MRGLHRHIWIGAWVVHWLVLFAHNFNAEEGSPLEYHDFNYFTLGVLSVVGVLYVVDAKKATAIFATMGATAGMFYGILEASQGKTSIDLGRLVYSEAPWLLTYSLFGGMVGMNILDLYRWLRKKWTEGDVGSQDGWGPPETNKTDRNERR